MQRTGSKISSCRFSSEYQYHQHGSNMAAALLFHHLTRIKAQGIDFTPETVTVLWQPVGLAFINGPAGGSGGRPRIGAARGGRGSSWRHLQPRNRTVGIER